MKYRVFELHFRPEPILKWSRLGPSLYAPPVAQIHPKALYLLVLTFNYTIILSAKWGQNPAIIELYNSIMELHKLFM